MHRFPLPNCLLLVHVEVGVCAGSVQLCLFANRLQYPTRKAIWIRTACLTAAQRFSLKPAGSRWINRTQRYRLNTCLWYSSLFPSVRTWSPQHCYATAPWSHTNSCKLSPLPTLITNTLKICTCAVEPSTVRCLWTSSEKPWKDNSWKNPGLTHSL